MKKVWVLQRKFTEEDKEVLEELKQEFPEIYREEKDYYDVVKSANYYKFCSSVKKEFNRADDFATKDLKELLKKQNCGQFIYTEDSKEEFRKIHLSVRDSYRVIECEVADDCKDYTTYTFVKENEGVKYFLWNERKPRKMYR